MSEQLCIMFCVCVCDRLRQFYLYCLLSEAHLNFILNNIKIISISVWAIGKKISNGTSTMKCNTDKILLMLSVH